VGFQPIFNANQLTLDQNTGTLPDVSGGIYDYFQPITFSQIIKTVVNFQVIETPTITACSGVWQPMGSRRLEIMPHGQRKWRLFEFWTTLAVQLQPDDVITYLSVQYRVLNREDWKLSGILHYDLAEDYTGSGPNPVPIGNEYT
jgi:hypothetical protein